MQCAVLGSPIEHSLSPVLHNAGFQAVRLTGWSYTARECTAEELPGVLQEASDEVGGYSVTMPCKFAALHAADEVTERARLIGSANTLIPTEHGWRADNTDCEGVTGALAEMGITHVDSAVIVGAGGTSRPALYALTRMGARHITVINRTPRAHEFADLVSWSSATVDFQPFSADIETLSLEADVLISTVPAAALDAYYKHLAHAPLLDVIYNPWPTPLATQCAANGYPVVGGYSMLVNQAFSQFEQFTGMPAPQEAMRDALRRAVSPSAAIRS